MHDKFITCINAAQEYLNAINDGINLRRKDSIEQDMRINGNDCAKTAASRSTVTPTSQPSDST